MSASELARVAGNLLEVHVEIAKREAQRDRKRITSAAVGIVVGLFLLLVTMALLEGVAVVALHERAHLDWPLALLAVAGCNALLGGALLYGASRRMKEPVLPATRTLVKSTLSALTG